MRFRDFILLSEVSKNGMDALRLLSKDDTPEGRLAADRLQKLDKKSENDEDLLKAFARHGWKINDSGYYEHEEFALGTFVTPHPEGKPDDWYYVSEGGRGRIIKAKDIPMFLDRLP